MKVVCFDLDDTLYKEIDYLDSAFRKIAQSLCIDEWEELYHRMIGYYHDKLDVFEQVVSLFPKVEKSDLIDMYRYRVQELSLQQDVYDVLSSLNMDSSVKLGLISDGRKITQTNKILALGLDKFFEEDMIIISESFGSSKPDERNFRYFMEKFPECSDFTYIGDNTQKDFIAPNNLGWTTICILDNGNNIHKQDFSLPDDFLPNETINGIKELRPLIARDCSREN